MLLAIFHADVSGNNRRQVAAGNHIHRKQARPNTDTNLSEDCGEVITEMSFVNRR
jgi:hypothetical protein